MRSWYRGWEARTPLFQVTRMNTLNFDRLWENLDKIILVVLLLVLVGFHSHMIGALGNSVDPSEAQQINWIEGIIGQVLAALLTLFVTDRSKKPQPELANAQEGKQ